ncbi:hypothetical protein GGD63_008101 [Bradyrhizobium sp. cir1]|uniref:hypothetical protein n=1 Tax=Bradyrhizobium sp. cir1 TaxID=1445730 RepID=UPI0016059930|nr:hypothetical protein [Bradyrhizobium sp. cir1]MBB4375252.1 hypothetical protein [Bradyrhizobium sp. cir1]
MRELMDGLVEVDADAAELVVDGGIEGPRLLHDDGPFEQHAAGIVLNAHIRLLCDLPDVKVLGRAEAAAQHLAELVVAAFARPGHDFAPSRAPLHRALGAGNDEPSPRRDGHSVVQRRNADKNFKDALVGVPVLNDGHVAVLKISDFVRTKPDIRHEQHEVVHLFGAPFVLWCVLNEPATREWGQAC